MATAIKKKLVQWDPTDVKAELLKKYPPKVARKRAKQIMINEALQNETPALTANVRTIPGIITMRGCTYAGCKGVILGPTRDIVNITHGPIGCAFYSWLTRRNQTDAGPDGENYMTYCFSTDMQEQSRTSSSAVRRSWKRRSRRLTTSFIPSRSPCSPPARWG
jgi:nitrogenase molybdenum-iron protein alpha chain